MPSEQTLADRLATLLGSLSAESRYHLETALGAAETAGVGGTLLVQVPRRTGEHPQVRWAGGSQQLALPL